MTTQPLRSHTLRLWRRFLPFGRVNGEMSDAEKQANGELTFVTTMGKIVATQVSIATSFRERFAGLLNRESLGAGDGMLFSPGGSIHTIGMRFSIDVLFLDRHMRVLKTVPGLAPWRAALAPAGTEFTLELATGRIAAATIGTGMRLLWSETGAEVNQ